MYIVTPFNVALFKDLPLTYQRGKKSNAYSKAIVFVTNGSYASCTRAFSFTLRRRFLGLDLFGKILEDRKRDVLVRMAQLAPTRHPP